MVSISKRLIIKQVAAIVGLIIIIPVMTIPIIEGLPPFGTLFNPIGGIWNGMYYAEYPYLMYVDGQGHSGTVYRDGYGIPHIFCSEETDLSFIVGYLQAHDRLFSMDMQRRQISGWLSEILGPGTDDANIEMDKLMRLFGFRRLAEELWQKMQADAPNDPELQKLNENLEAYAAGVNKFILECLPYKLPFEYVFLGIQPKTWDVVDTLTLAKYMSWALCFNDVDLDSTIIANAYNKSVAAKLVPEVPFEFEDVVIPNFTQPENESDGNPIITMGFGPSPETDPKFLENAAAQASIVKDAFKKLDNTLRDLIRFDCSNNWVVNGSLTDTGYPILCGDPHLMLMVPSVWWCMQYVNTSNPDDCFYGVSFPGTPLIQIGFTTHTAWSATVTAVDVTDFYYEEFSQDKTQYKFNNTWRDVYTKTETISVLGRAPVQFEMRYTKHDYNSTDDFWCPVIPSDFTSTFGNFTDISMKSTYMLADYGILKGFYRLIKTKSYQDYIEALKPYGYPGQNFVFADTLGNIALFPKSFYPIRNATGTQLDEDGFSRGRFIMNGSSGNDEWTMYIPFEWIPHKVNPDQMYLVSANQRTVNTSEYPYYLGYAFAEGYRGNRINMLIREKISQGQNITVQDMMNWQKDVYDVAASVFVPQLLDAANQYYGGSFGTTADLLNQSLEILTQWNQSGTQQYRMLKELIAPTIFDFWLKKYLNLTFIDEWTDASIVGKASLPQTMLLQNLTLNDPTSHWFNQTSTAKTENASDIMLLALNETIDELSTEYGASTASWIWGDIHKLKIQYLQGMLPAFDYPYYSFDGGDRTVMVAHGLDVKLGQSMRLIVDFSRLKDTSDLTPVYHSVPGGQNGNPASSHYSDLFELWRTYEYFQPLFPRTITAMPTNQIISTTRFLG
ncbi:MAG: penicillin acylase family protein [Candidatus Helarchaeota archaeon]